MKIIHKSILKELSLTFILSLACLNFILMMEKLIRLSRFLSGVGSSATDMVTLIMYIQPQLFLLTIPMALLLSTLLTYGRLNMDNELVILRASGMDFKGISAPVIIVGLLCFSLNIAVSFYLGPKSSIALREKMINIIKMRAPLAIEEGRFNTSFKNTLIFVKEKTADNKMRGIFMYDNRNKNEPRVLTAKEGKIFAQDEMNINLLLEDGYINIVNDKSITDLFFKKYNLIMKLESDTPGKKHSELTPYELMEKIKNYKSEAMSLYPELYRRFSLPLLCIILMFFGPPLSMIAGKSGKLGGLTLGLAVFTSYYMLLIYSENLFKVGKVPHYIGAWIPTLIIGILALSIFWKESSR